MEERIQKIMNNLSISRDEAIALINDDKAIDKGEKMDFDLSPEQEKASKKARKASRKKPTVYNFETRKRKENVTKRELITRIFEVFKDEAGAEITNPERVIAFSIGEDKFEIVLQQKRKPKE